jgi:hypothetical protein
MSARQVYSPLKIGLLIVVIAYFLFTLHVMLTLEWIGEWERLTSTRALVIFVEDISASIGVIFRLAAGLIALATIVLYFTKKGLSTQTATKTLRMILIAEAIYWLGLLPSGILPLIYLRSGFSSPVALLTTIISYDLPALVESISIPIALFILAFKLNQCKPKKEAIKWALITGALYIFVFWLVNTGVWIATIRQKGTEYLTAYPENLLSFGLTAVGLLSLTIYATVFTKNSAGADMLNKVKPKPLGAMIMALGLYYLWNYATWIFFGRNELWSPWYAWILGHNLDLWMLALPLVGLPLLFEPRKLKNEAEETLQQR